MRLIVNCVLPTSTFHLLRADLQPVSTHTVDITGAEYHRLLPELEGFLTSMKQDFKSLTHIYCITGPTPFTGGRIVTLTLGAIAKIYPMELVGITLFEYWSMFGNHYPMACGANATEYILAASPTNPLELCPIENLDLTTLRTWNLTRSRLHEGQSPLHYSEALALADFSALNTYVSSKTLDPLYLKKPNITLSR
jgi:tRNA A37 threonylcarbamoyladenosine modification protein TsaB